MKATYKIWKDKRVYVTLEGVSKYQHDKGLFVEVETGKANNNLRYIIGFKNEEEIARIEEEAINFFNGATKWVSKKAVNGLKMGKW